MFHMRRVPIVVQLDSKHTDRSGRPGVRALRVDKDMGNDTTRPPEETPKLSINRSGGRDGVRKGHQNPIARRLVLQGRQESDRSDWWEKTSQEPQYSTQSLTWEGLGRLCALVVSCRNSHQVQGKAAINCGSGRLVHRNGKDAERQCWRKAFSIPIGTKKKTGTHVGADQPCDKSKCARIPAVRLREASI